MKAKFLPRIRLEDRPRLEKLIPLPTPFIINVDPADVCNFQCKFCPTGDRELMRKTKGRMHGLLGFDLFIKIVDDILEFENPLKVLRLYKDGEPLLNPKFSDMVAYAKQKGCAGVVDTTTNAALLSPELSLQLIEAGLDRINISLYGVRDDQYRDFTQTKISFQQIVDNVAYFYEHSRGKCVVHVKINGDVISADDQNRFLDLFGDIADEVFIEHVMACWPEFDLDSRDIHTNPNVGIYGQAIEEVLVCPYIFYSFSINSSGIASACFLDWERRLVIGDVRQESVQQIWQGNLLSEHQRMMLQGTRKQHPICGKCDQLRRGMPDNIDPFMRGLLQKIMGK
ncbi:MAG: radical SAM/SPASM domain-containing protein [Patescibacteria group bacterium]|nr:radical SAM/SPASM domain-containing protein [Patescibacteria group bacterium]